MKLFEMVKVVCNTLMIQEIHQSRREAFGCRFHFPRMVLLRARSSRILVGCESSSLGHGERCLTDRSWWFDAHATDCLLDALTPLGQHILRETSTSTSTTHEAYMTSPAVRFFMPSRLSVGFHIDGRDAVGGKEIGRPEVGRWGGTGSVAMFSQRDRKVVRGLSRLLLKAG